MSNQSINHTYNQTNSVDQKRCIDVARSRLEPCSLATSTTQTNHTCIPETLSPTTYCTEEADCHDLYCTSETCIQAEKCEETNSDFCLYGPKDTGKLSNEELTMSSENTSPCCKNKTVSNSTLNRPGNPSFNPTSDLSQIPNIGQRWDPNSSLSSSRKNNSKLRGSEAQSSRSVIALERNTIENAPTTVPSAQDSSKVRCSKSNRCKSARCSVKVDECPCHFPPTFSQYSCTGKIIGSCNCANHNPV